MPTLSQPIVILQDSPSGLIRQRWVFSIQGVVVSLDRYHYERRRSAKKSFETIKLYDRGRNPEDDYGDWTWLTKDEVPWEDDLVAEVLSRVASRFEVVR